ncbi:hypothetical protein LUZ63_013157 [Rhynchospora breviuscula]|uniref:Protein kinase domain-containing protein n=1 Tax=Rhynchospora breviuscula TaxID=2022672 RepID=A0A9Q0C878_9POAL|nr:hypothetical protein LUZ63_013157 [Rhynchospora breviuscula]
MMDEKFWIFLELATQGSLVSQYGKKGLQDSQASAYTLQILHGLIYLNHCKIIHRDIKCANILVDSEGCVKLADFGVAKEIDLLVQKHSLKGTVRWMAPEVAKSTPYGPPADIWSLGCTVLEMLTGHPPHPELTEWQHVFFAVVNGKKPPIPDTLSNAARNFIEECLQVDPQKRPSAIALLEHPFVDHDFLDAGADPGDGGHRPGLRREKKYQRKILKLTETRL